MTSKKSLIEETAALWPQHIRLVIQGAHIPSFKNAKRTGRSGAVFTGRKIKQRMDAIIQSIESQLLSEIVTRARETSTASLARSWILSLLPVDDSNKWVPEIKVSYEQVSPGEEGAVIFIERI